jgi:hypothetical protein
MGTIEKIIIIIIIIIIDALLLEKSSTIQFSILKHEEIITVVIYG